MIYMFLSNNPSSGGYKLVEFVLFELKYIHLSDKVLIDMNEGKICRPNIIHCVDIQSSGISKDQENKT